MDKTTTNSVRQVLMNELGLTRESIRQHAEQIVVDTVRAHLSTDRIEQIVKRTVIESLLASYSVKRIMTEIDTTARREVQELIRNNVKITVSAP
jgi:hypothetical protein